MTSAQRYGDLKQKQIDIILSNLDSSVYSDLVKCLKVFEKHENRYPGIQLELFKSLRHISANINDIPLFVRLVDNICILGEHAPQTAIIVLNGLAHAADALPYDAAWNKINDFTQESLMLRSAYLSIRK
ncbi:MAG: hypothetical protein ABR981_05380 [Candidatus Micrarchaeaceae archaeon]|jgi:hypothetical protein